MLKIYTIDEIGEYGVIYKLTSPSGKIYIGQSWKFKNRMKAYKNYNKLIIGKKLYNALIKYKYENFMIEIIDLAETKIELNNKEIFYIDLYDSANIGYNCTIGGCGGGGKGRHSIEGRKKISLANRLRSKELKQKIVNTRIKNGSLYQSNDSKRKNSINNQIYIYHFENINTGEKFNVDNIKIYSIKNNINAICVARACKAGRIYINTWKITRTKIKNVNTDRWTLEAKQKLSELKKGHKLSAETIEKIRIKHTGRTLTPEHKEKVKITSTGRKHSEETKIKIKNSNKNRLHTN